MTQPLETLLTDPPKEDSDDLTDDEVAAAIETKDSSGVVQRLRGEIIETTFTVKAHELRRRGDSLFWRVRLVAGDVEKVLVFRADWLGG